MLSSLAILADATVAVSSVAGAAAATTGGGGGGGGAAGLSAASVIPAVLFWMCAILTGGSAIGVVASKNIVRTAVYLLGTLGGAAGLYFLLAAEFIAAVQLVVYAGGTLILIVFGVMLTAKSPFSKLQATGTEAAIALATGAILLVTVVSGAVWMHANRPAGAAELAVGENYPMVRLGTILLGDYLIPFEVVSVLLLAVMIGAAYLAKARKRGE